MSDNFLLIFCTFILIIFGFTICRMLSTAVRREATHRRPHQMAGMRGECGIRPMAIHTAQLGAWEWAWEPTATVRAATPPSLYTRRREKIETTSCPPLGISIPVNESDYLLNYVTLSFSNYTTKENILL